MDKKSSTDRIDRSNVIVRGQIDGQDVTILIDTGSQATLASGSLVNGLRRDKDIRPSLLKLTSFSKDSIPSLGEVNLDLSIAGLTGRHSCIVVPDMECDILLGMDFMSLHNIAIHTGTGLVSSDKGSVTFIRRPRQLTRRTKVRATETTIIPPQCVMFIKGTMQDTTDKRTAFSGYLEPYDNLAANSNLLLASALVYSDAGEVPVRVLNSTDEPVVLHKRKLIGFLNPCGNRDVSQVTVQRISESRDSAQGTGDAKPTEPEWSKTRLYKELKVDDMPLQGQDRQRIKDILWRNRSCFSRHEFDLGTCNFFEANINLKPDAKPQYVPPIPIPYKHRDTMDKHIQGMKDAGIIEETNNNSPWNSRVFLVPKPHQPGKFRFVADFRALNAQCLPDAYLLPNVNHVTDRMCGAKWFSTFDLSKSFFQLKYDKASQQTTAFSVDGRRYIFNRMVMGHMTSSSQFARAMDHLLSNIPLDQLCYFLDDLCVASNDITSHLDRLDMVLGRLAASNLKLLPKKCSFLKKEIQFIGLTINENGMSINTDRVEAITKLEPPRTVKEAMQLMGFLTYNRKFVKNFAALAKPIYQLIDRSNPKRKVNWNSQCNDNLEEIKRRIAEGVTLAIPDVDDSNQSYIVTIDASNDGYGAELTQLQHGERRIVAYFSKRVPKHKRDWSQSKLEFEGLVETLLHWGIYLRGTRFLVRTDCLSLLALESLFAKADSTMIRRLNKLADFQFDIQHLAGSANNTADFLSRYVYRRRDCHVATQTDTLTTEVGSASLGTNPVVHTITTDNQTSASGKDLTFDDNLRDVHVVSLAETVVDEDFIDPIIPEDILISEWSAPPQLITEADITDEDITEALSTQNNACICNQPHAFAQIHSTVDTGCVQAISADSTTNIAGTDNNQQPQLIDLKAISEAQKKDPIISLVRQWVEKGEKPSTLQQLRTPPDMIRLWKQFKLLTMRQDLLCRKWIRRDKDSNETEVIKCLVIIPESHREQVMCLYHSSRLTAHPGIDETYRQCLLSTYWPKMREDIELYVQACVTCGRVKQPQAYLRAPLQHVIAHDFNDILCIDHIVPEKEGTTPRRNRYILTMTDIFTGYVVAVATRTKESEETIRVILNGWILRFGCPKEIIADNDKSFTSIYFNSILKAFDIKPTHGTPYKCASTSKVERANKRINTALRVTLTDSQLRNWDVYLNLVCFALNGLKSRHTGFTANRLVFAKELYSPLTLVVDNEPVTIEPGVKYSAKAFALHKTLKQIIRQARRHAELDFKYSDNYYNKHLHGPYFKEGDWCFTLISCPKHKFSARWKGPYRIGKVISDHLYVIELEDGKDKLVNISKLKRYKKNRYSPPSLDPAAPEFTPQSPENTNDTLAEDPETPAAAGLAVDINIDQQTEDSPPDQTTIPPNDTDDSTDTDDNTTWFDNADEAVIVAPPDPFLVPILRRSNRNRRKTVRFQAGFA